MRSKSSRYLLDQARERGLIMRTHNLAWTTRFRMTTLKIMMKRTAKKKAVWWMSLIAMKSLKTEEETEAKEMKEDRKEEETS